MSADNWGICPKCRVVKLKKLESLRDRLEADYGKIAREQYKTLEGEVAEAKNARDKRTLREDYEIATDEDGLFYVSYRGGCDVCGLLIEFEHSHEVEINA